MEHELFCRISSDFAERLKELMEEHGESAKELARAVGVSEVSVYQYIEGRHFPRSETIVKLADRYACTVDFLLGLKEQNTAEKFAPRPPFSERLCALLKEFSVSKYYLAKKLKLSPSLLYYWQTGQKVPTAEHLAALSMEFGCSVDYVLGREL